MTKSLNTILADTFLPGRSPPDLPQADLLLPPEHPPSCAPQARLCVHPAQTTAPSLHTHRKGRQCCCHYTWHTHRYTGCQLLLSSNAYYYLSDDGCNQLNWSSHIATTTRASLLFLHPSGMQQRNIQEVPQGDILVSRALY